VRVTTFILVILVAVAQLLVVVTVGVPLAMQATLASTDREANNALETVVASEQVASLAQEGVAMLFRAHEGIADAAQLKALDDQLEASLVSLEAANPWASPYLQEIRAKEDALFGGDPADQTPLFAIASAENGEHTQAMALNRRQFDIMGYYMAATGVTGANRNIDMFWYALNAERDGIHGFSAANRNGPGAAAKVINSTFASNTMVRIALALEAADQADALATLAEGDPARAPASPETLRAAAEDLRALVAAEASVPDDRDGRVRAILADLAGYGDAAVETGLERGISDGVPGQPGDLSLLGALQGMHEREGTAVNHIQAYFGLVRQQRDLLQFQVPVLIQGLDTGSAALVGAARARLEAAVAERAAAFELYQRAEWAAGALTLTCIVALGVLLGRRLGKRLGAFRAAAAEVAEGRFDLALPPKAGDELDPLAEAWGQMSRALIERDAVVARAAKQAVQRERMATLGGLSAGVAHEINNPLTFVKGNTQFTIEALGRWRDDPGFQNGRREELEETERGLREALMGIDRIARIVSSLRLLAKPVAREQRVGLKEVLESALTLASDRTRNRVAVEVDIAALLPEVVGNPDELGQVFLNLLINAADAVPKEGGRIAVKALAEDGCVVVEVEDNGPGIPAVVRDRLFEAFFTTKPKGTGLGLAISRSIILGHGGDIGFTTADGHGTKFKVVLPAAPPEPPQKGAPPAPARVAPRSRTEATA
jgi:two-component system, NtrC family, sensor kinase